MPFLLLPFRPTSDPSAVKTFIRHYFDRSQNIRGEELLHELRLTEPMVSYIPQWTHGHQLTPPGTMQRRQMVLESAGRRSSFLGVLRTFQSWGARYSIQCGYITSNSNFGRFEFCKRCICNLHSLERGLQCASQYYLPFLRSLICHCRTFE